MNRDKSRSIWELLSDVFREVSILLWVFGVLLDHGDQGFSHGTFLAVLGMILFCMSLIFERQRGREGERN